MCVLDPTAPAGRRRRRRLAHLHTRLQGAGFFAEDAMRCRHPVLHAQVLCANRWRPRAAASRSATDWTQPAVGIANRDRL